MSRKYIDDLGIKYIDTPQGWSSDGSDKRIPYWMEQREKYGFDERETWSLDYSFMLWFYERLMMYNEVNIVNTSFHRYEYKDETITFQDCINRMIEGCKVYLVKDSFDLTDEDYEKINDVYQLLALCHNQLWW